MQNPNFIIDSQLKSLFKEALKALVNQNPLPEMEVEFYPYTGLMSKIRLRQGRIYVRVSDILKDAPPEVLYSLACILIAKLYKKNVPIEQNNIYKDYTLRQSVRDASETLRRERGYKFITSPQGKYYDLSAMFDDMNARYFAGQMKHPVLSWSQQESRRILGHQDHIHDAIVISRTLDNARTPRFVVEYVLYHEMLHIKHPTRLVNGRKVIHGREFRADERNFDKFEAAKNWLENNAPPVKRRRRRKRR